MQLQAELSKLQAQAETLRQRFLAAEQVEITTTELRIERARLLKRLQDDYTEQHDQLARAIVAFQRLSTELYEIAGSLRVKATRSLSEKNFGLS